MSTGENITNAAFVIQQTYRNLTKLFRETDEEASKAGYCSITPRFLRYKSDTDISGWMIGSFIKLYQHRLCQEIPDSGGLLDGPVFGIDVTLYDEGIEYPTLTVAKYSYEDGSLHRWGKLPAVNEHWGFHYPTRRKDDMIFEESGDGVTRGTIRPNKSNKDYWGLEEVVFTRMNLVSVDSRQAIRDSIVAKFDFLRAR